MTNDECEFEDYLIRIDKHLVRENYNIGMGFSSGWVFFKVQRRETFHYLYDLIAEIPTIFNTALVPAAIDMASLQYVTALELPSASLGNTTNIFTLSNKKHAYQIFYGVSPSVLRVFPAYPRGTEINELDAGMHTQTYPVFGSVEGFESPLNAPSPRSMLFIPYSALLGFAFHNPAPYNIQPLLRFIVNRLEIEPINDPEYVMKILENRVECTKATLGGIDNPFTVNNAQFKEWWGVLPVKLGANRNEVDKAVRGVG